MAYQAFVPPEIQKWIKGRKKSLFPYWYTFEHKGVKYQIVCIYKIGTGNRYLYAVKNMDTGEIDTKRQEHLVHFCMDYVNELRKKETKNPTSYGKKRTGRIF